MNLGARIKAALAQGMEPPDPWPYREHPMKSEQEREAHRAAIVTALRKCAKVCMDIAFEEIDVPWPYGIRMGEPAYDGTPRPVMIRKDGAARKQVESEPHK